MEEKANFLLFFVSSVRGMAANQPAIFARKENKDIPPYSVAAGVPDKVIKARK